MKRLLIALGIVASGIVYEPITVYATNHSAIAAATSLTDGEIRKVDKDAKKLTIRHGPLENLNMPPMTMVFQVKDQSMLDSVKPGDKVRFSADKVGGAYTVTHLEPSK
jgi:Cu/Ag efflux protein CusF